MSPAPAARWTDDRDAQLARLWGEETPVAQIGKAMALSRNAVMGRVHRLRDAGDQRFAQRRFDPVTRLRHLSPIDALAEVMSLGCSNIASAARRVGRPVAELEADWRRICADLGPQAR